MSTFKHEHTDDRPQGVVITGMGAVSPFGLGCDALWHGLTHGRNAFERISLFDPTGHRTEIGAEVEQLPDIAPARLRAGLLSRVDRLGLAAAQEALMQANLLDPDSGQTQDQVDLGLIGATAAGNILGLEEFFQHRFLGTDCDAEPLLSSFHLSSLADILAAEFRIRGPRRTLATVCSSSGLALAAAFELLSSGACRRVLVVGAETLSRVTHAGFNNLRSVAADCCRPFDSSRQGLILGEGAGGLVLETADSAAERGAEPLCSLRGYGLATDSHHFTAPDPTGTAVKQVLSQALHRAGLQPSDIDYINAHGTGTQLNDKAEILGLNAALGERVGQVFASSCKSMLGHLLGAASIVEALATILALRHDTVPPTANLEQPEFEDGPLLPTQATGGHGLCCALSNSFAFGGSNVSLAFCRQVPQAEVRCDRENRHVQPAITGLGLVSPYGIGREAFLEGLNRDLSGLSNLSRLGSEWSGLLGGLVDMDTLRQAIPASRRRHLNRQGMFLSLSLEQALEQSGLDRDGLKAAQMAYGTAFGCSGSVHEFYTQLLDKGPKLALPQHFMLSVTNAPAAMAAQWLGLTGPVWVFVGGEASFESALHWACDMIAVGRTGTALVCAAEEVNASIVDIHKSLGFFCPEATPGFSLGEGAICLVLEHPELAAARKAPVLGHVAGWRTEQDCGCRPQSYTPEPDGLLQAARHCLQAADRPADGLVCFGPANGTKPLHRVDRQVMEALANEAWIFPADPLRTRLGESGLGGGFAAAAGLLASRPPDRGGSLILSSARGGVQAATIISRTPSHDGSAPRPSRTQE
jgi:3-oxoacyl-[acyl-carrier-protein] synthase II